MEKSPAENHFHYNRTTFVQKAFYIGLGITAALAIKSCAPTTFNRLSDAYERAKDVTLEQGKKLVEGPK